MAIVRLYIIDDKTLKGIPGALVEFIDYDGATVVSQYRSDSNGVVTLDTVRNSFELEPGRQVWVSADGYGQAGILGGDVGLYDGYEIDMSKQASPFPWWELLAAGAVVYLATRDKKKTVGGVGNVGILGVIGVVLAEALEPKKTFVKF